MLGKLSKVGWYWHRLRAMSASEVALRLQKKSFQRADAHYKPPRGLLLDPNGPFPVLPERSSAPAALLEGLRRDAEEILAGRWRAFGHLPLAMSDPPEWHADNLVGKNLRSARVAFKLDHRAQPGGADIKVIWEPSRWYQLVRLAMAAWLLDHSRAQEKCIEWLSHWARENVPFTGLNWTSGLETGIRLIQFAWIDRFLTAAGAPNKTLQELREQILPPHIWYTWRYKSFGSSANNHLIGELAGLIVALARWPQLQSISANLPTIAQLLEREILAQFAEDGGNNEQALSYHLFSWEFCWQSIAALDSAKVPVDTTARARLIRAGEFYRDIKPEGDPWDFGDSDNAWVTPHFADETECAREWWRWFNDSASSPALRFWWGDFPLKEAPTPNTWKVSKASGYAILKTQDWFLRLDFSPLGYLSMAPHGHLDALHLSVWFRGSPIIIDPGTGAYYADKIVRNYLADWSAHNGPQLATPPTPFPVRRGTFLWGNSHDTPVPGAISASAITAELQLPSGKAIRTVSFLPASNAVRIEDRFEPQSSATIATRWKFSPDCRLENGKEREFSISSPTGTLALKVSPGWKIAASYNPPAEYRTKNSPVLSALGDVPPHSIVSPAFRSLAAAPYLALESSGNEGLKIELSPE